MKPDGLWKTFSTTPPLPEPSSPCLVKSSSLSSPSFCLLVKNCSRFFLSVSLIFSSSSFLVSASRLCILQWKIRDDFLPWLLETKHHKSQYYTSTYFGASPAPSAPPAWPGRVSPIAAALALAFDILLVTSTINEIYQTLFLGFCGLRLSSDIFFTEWGSRRVDTGHCSWYD